MSDPIGLVVELEMDVGERTYRAVINVERSALMQARLQDHQLRMACLRAFRMLHNDEIRKLKDQVFDLLQENLELKAGLLRRG